jgi:hypothetical protein
MLDKKGSDSSLAKSPKGKFTDVNDHFKNKRNAEIELFLSSTN